jgi:hypothetical protein
VKKLPKIVYLRWEEPQRDEQYLDANVDPQFLLDGPSDKKRVGRYELVETLTVESSVRLRLSARRKT